MEGQNTIKRLYMADNLALLDIGVGDATLLPSR